MALVLGPLETPPGPKCLSSQCYFHVLLKPLAAPVGFSAARAAAALGGGLGAGVRSAGGAGSRARGRGRAGGGAGSFERWMEGQLHTLLQHLVAPGEYPRCLVQLTVMILQDDGAVESVCINAALAALIDAGIALRFRAWSATLVRLNRDACVAHSAGRATAAESPSASHAVGEHSGAPEPNCSGGGRAAAAGEGEWRIDPCSEEEDERRKEAALCLVLEPQTGDLVSSFFERSIGSSAAIRSAADGASVSGRSRSGLAVAGAGLACPGGGLWGAGADQGGGRLQGDDAGDCLLRALAASRHVDACVREAFRVKMETPFQMFQQNNFWWKSSVEDEVDMEDE
ncbi:3' exoribonuclease family, domain 1 domain-containing protein [Besnoitia besnoiti]|uniref:3' exoribonuclease family, domain 1 domain-containing protein n=1 Tax=Besnoitia besnoiti TaxID=94643 RepID=A0A2A9MA38_BESBE|nr:3' exoribonuclease family, domain 1 domain-containing protein [Besnoitia besnoiti]PFH32543.1 3' exoribonuclease family, domain 1 domain-containing protein [Besnoitia besnoiti]